jgi:hypothetical protein
MKFTILFALAIYSPIALLTRGNKPIGADDVLVKLESLKAMLVILDLIKDLLPKLRW